MNPAELLPHLKERNLLSDEDIKYLISPHTEKEKRRRILACAPSCDFNLFVESIFSEKNDSGHIYLSRRLREAIEKKRNNPFSELIIMFSYIERKPEISKLLISKLILYLIF